MPKVHYMQLGLPYPPKCSYSGIITYDASKKTRDSGVPYPSAYIEYCPNRARLGGWHVVKNSAHIPCVGEKNKKAYWWLATAEAFAHVFSRTGNCKDGLACGRAILSARRAQTSSEMKRFSKIAIRLAYPEYSIQRVALGGIISFAPSVEEKVKPYGLFRRPCIADVITDPVTAAVDL